MRERFVQTELQRRAAARLQTEAAPVQMMRALEDAEERQEADRVQMLQALAGAEQRQQAAAAEQADRASAELRELTNKVEASANTEKRAQDHEKSITEEARRVVRGADEAQQATTATVAKELWAAAEANARLAAEAREAAPAAHAEQATAEVAK